MEKNGFHFWIWRRKVVLILLKKHRQLPPKNYQCTCKCNLHHHDIVMKTVSLNICKCILWYAIETSRSYFTNLEPRRDFEITLKYLIICSNVWSVEVIRF